MKIELLEISGLEVARKAMRNPMKSWDKASPEADLKLLKALLNGGDEENKILRIPDIYIEVIAPRYWWVELDTYKVGMDMISESTVHTLMRDGVEEDDFEWVNGPIQFEIDSIFKDHPVIKALNLISDSYRLVPNTPEGRRVKNQLLRQAKAILPEGFLQKRTLKFNIQTARRIWKQRHNHKLPEWHIFCDFLANLPEIGWMITYQPKKEFKGFEVFDTLSGKLVDEEIIFEISEAKVELPIHYIDNYFLSLQPDGSVNVDVIVNFGPDHNSLYSITLDRSRFEVRLK